MADILESAQKQINEAAKQTAPGSSPPSDGPSSTTPAVSLPPSEPAPSPLTQPTLSHTATPTPTIIQPPVASTPVVLPVTPPVIKPPDITHFNAPAIPPSPPEGVVVPPPNANNPAKSKRSKIGLVIATLLVLFITLPVAVFFLSQRNAQIADNRSKAAGPCSPNGEGSHCGTDGWYVCENFSWTNKGWINGCTAGGGGGTNPQPTSPPASGGGSTIEGQNCSPAKAVTCSNGKKHFCQDNGKWSGPGESCSGSGTCNISSYSCSGTTCYARNAMQASGQCGDVQVDPSMCGSSGCGGVTGGGSCTGYTFNVAAGRCDAANVNQCRNYSECCAPGKSRTIKATCLASGQEQFDVITACNDATSSVCGTAAAPGPVTPLCQPGEFYWPRPDGDDACHDISAPANPGGGTANCSATGCTKTATQCIKRWTCSQSELTAQGFCLRNMSSAEAGRSYQAEADATCKYIQIDVYDQAYCPDKMTSTTPHAGTIIFRPANPNGCAAAPTNPPSQPTSPPSASSTPVVAQCNDIKVYDAANTDITAALVAKTSAVKAGDKITIAIRGSNAVKGRFRVNSSPETWKYIDVKNAKGEFTEEFIVPIDRTHFKIEAQVTNNGTVWN